MARMMTDSEFERASTKRSERLHKEQLAAREEKRLTPYKIVKRNLAALKAAGKRKKAAKAAEKVAVEKKKTAHSGPKFSLVKKAGAVPKIATKVKPKKPSKYKTIHPFPKGIWRSQKIRKKKSQKIKYKVTID